MSLRSRVSQRIQHLLTHTADHLGRLSGCIQRTRKLTGALFAQILVLGWWQDPQATLEKLSQTAAALGVSITPQSLHERFGPASARFMQSLFDETLHTLVTTDPAAIPLFERFRGVYIQDTSTVSLPDALSPLWQGCGHAQSPTAALKLHVCLDLSHGTLLGPFLQHGRTHDNAPDFQEQLAQCFSQEQAALPQGALHIADLGYFGLDRFEQLSKDKVFWLSRCKRQCHFYDDKGRHWTQEAFFSQWALERVDMTIYLGVKKRLAARLLAVRVPAAVVNARRRRLREYARKKGVTPTKASLRLAEWTVLVTSVPEEQLSLDEALILMRARWQIELLFKLWKQEGQIAVSRSEQPWRILTELYAKLIAMVLQHWVLLLSCWHRADRSLVKATQVIRRYTVLLVEAFAQDALAQDALAQIEAALATIERIVQTTCRVARRRTQPSAFQLWLGEASP